MNRLGLHGDWEELKKQGYWEKVIVTQELGVALEFFGHVSKLQHAVPYLDAVMDEGLEQNAMAHFHCLQVVLEAELV